MPRRYPPEVRRQVVELARSGTKVPSCRSTFGMSEATIYNWLRQEQIDRGEDLGHEHRHALDLAAAKRRIRQLETELASLARSTRCSSSRACPKGSTR